MISQLSECDIAKLGVQLHHGAAGWNAQLVDDCLMPDIPLPDFKPAWGFWTSSRIEDGQSEWSRAAKSMGIGRGTVPYEFQVVNQPRVLQLCDDDDVRSLMGQYGEELFTLNMIFEATDFTQSSYRRLEDSWSANLRTWRAVTRDYDAVHVPDCFSRASALRSWDVESTVWFRPNNFLKKL